MAAECGAGNDAVNTVKGCRAEATGPPPPLSAGPGSVPPPLTGRWPGFPRGLRPAGVGLRGAAGALGAQKGAQDGVGVVGHGCSLVPWVGRSCGGCGRVGSAAQDDGTAGGRGPAHHGGHEHGSARTGHRRRRRTLRPDGAVGTAHRSAGHGVEVVVLAAGTTAHARRRCGECRPGRGVGAGHDEDEQQDEDPQPRATAPDGVPCGAHAGPPLRTVTARAGPGGRAGAGPRP